MANAKDFDLKKINLETYTAHGFKSLLQEYCQKRQAEYPRYLTIPVNDENPSSSLFTSSVLAMGGTYKGGQLRTKKEAEQDAAKQALMSLQLAISEPQMKALGNIAMSTEELQTVKEVLNTVNALSPTSVPSNSNTMSPSFTAHKVPCPFTIPGTTKSYKNHLQELAQKLGYPLPDYRITDIPQGFIGQVHFDGKWYAAPGWHRTKKVAEQATAKYTLETLQVIKEVPPQDAPQSPYGISSPSAGTPAIALTFGTLVNRKMLAGPYLGPYTSDNTIPYKNILQEHLMQRGLKSPGYITAPSGFQGFLTTVHFCGKTLTNPKPEATKKLSEQMAAREALINLGFDDPEMLGTAIMRKKARKAESASESDAMSPPSNAMFKPLDEDDLLLQKVLPRRASLGSKRPREEEDTGLPNKKLKLDDPSQSTGDVPLLALSVGEVWRERRNVVVVGNGESSHILLTRATSGGTGRCQLLNTRTMELVDLEPGQRLVGLDAVFVEYQGKVALKAERCADIETPTLPDPVLTSCGVAIMHLDPHESKHQILLQRHIFSQPFINVVQSIAMFLRRTVAARPVKLDIDQLTFDIREWLPHEVTMIMEMEPEEIKKIHPVTKKVGEKTLDILKPPLPKDLKELQACARDEHARRQKLGVVDVDVHPWGLPKGNFKHRIITTGLHIETPVECAVRELREETGIMLDPCDVEKMTYVDLLRKYNHNPHKGDTVRYYLYVCNPLKEDLITSYFNAGIFPDRSLDQSLDTTLSPSSKLPSTPITTTASSSYAALTPSPSVVSQHPTVHLTPTRFDSQRRGVKRRRSEEDTMERETKPGLPQTPLTPASDSSTPLRKTPKLEHDTSTGSTVGHLSPRFQSPIVHGGLNEECAWFPIEDACKKSPVFEEILNTKEFQQLLLSSGINRN